MIGPDQRRRAPDRRLAAALLLLSLLVPSAASSQSPPPEATPIFDSSRTSLLQVRTLLRTSGRQSAIGSGFVVDASLGLAVTNYHVVSMVAQDPDTYRLEFRKDSGATGDLRIVALDVANDLAVVALPGPAETALPFEADALVDRVPQGERLFAMGNPLDLGFTIVEGTYNGIVERGLLPRLHYTGAINPGMSGGPAVDSRGAVVGVNVSKRLDGELVSFLVPIKSAAALLERARSEPLAEQADYKDAIAAQVVARQRQVAAQVIASGFKDVQSGPYLSPEPTADWFECWSSTNADRQPTPRVLIDGTQCQANGQVYISDEVQVGTISFVRNFVRSEKLGPLQFATALSHQYDPDSTRSPWRSELTAPHCRDRFVSGGDDRPVLRASWCAAAYRDYAGLYDIRFVFVTQDHDDEALVAEMSLEGFDFDTGVELARRYIDQTRWAP